MLKEGQRQTVFGLLGQKDVVAVLPTGFGKRFLNLPVVRGSETQTKRKERGISCIAIAIYYQI